MDRIDTPRTLSFFFFVGGRRGAVRCGAEGAVWLEALAPRGLFLGRRGGLGRRCWVVCFASAGVRRESTKREDPTGLAWGVGGSRGVGVWVILTVGTRGARWEGSRWRAGMEGAGDGAWPDPAKGGVSRWSENGQGQQAIA